MSTRGRMARGPGVPGCGMRSVVGFLSRRAVLGEPLLREDFKRRRLAACTNLYRKDLLGHFGCVNAIEFSNGSGSMLVSGGDDRRVLLWHIEESIHSKAKPIQLKGEHHSNIFCLAFNSSNTKVFSGGNDEQVLLHDVESGETLDVFTHEEAVYGLSVSPVNDNVFASSSDDGRVLIWDIRESTQGDPFCLAHYPSAFHSVMFNPVEPRLLATANSKEGVGLWDIRKPNSSLLRYGGNLSLQSAMSVRFNSNGTRLLALRRRLPPVLYDIHSRLPIFQFDNQGYFNSCTMKSCCFAGDRDQFILSGSDDFNLYMWKIPSNPEAGGAGRVVNGAFMVLKGHRSIVNQVRFNPENYMICSSGVEKIIKIWSPYQQPNCSGDLDGHIEDDSRSLYTHEEYIGLVLNSGSGLSHDYANQSIQEDPRMMAFFDSLVRREIEGWSSDSDSDSTILQLHPGISERSAYSDSESSASEPSSPLQMPGLSDEGVTAGDSQRSIESPTSRHLRLLALRRHQDNRLSTISNNSDSEENACETEAESEPFHRPRSPSPNEERSSSSNDEEDNLNNRRTSMRQRNARRHNKKRAEKSKASNTNTVSVIGEDLCDYPQIHLHELSTSAESSPGVRSPNEGERKSSLCSSIDSVERKIYKAYKWLHHSYISYSKGREGETSTGDRDCEDGRPGTSGRSSALPPVKETETDCHILNDQENKELPSNDMYTQDLQKASLLECIDGCGSDQNDKQLLLEDIENSCKDDASLEPPLETKKLNGQAHHKEFFPCFEDSCDQCCGKKNNQNHQQALSEKDLLSTKDSTTSFEVSLDDLVGSQNEEIEGGETEITYTHQSNGHLHTYSSAFNNTGQTCEEPVTSMLCSQTHVSLGQAQHKDSNLTDVDCSMNSKDVLTSHVDTENATSSGGLKRHRQDYEELDHSSEKKMKI
ncbi:DDB1- and CUL4-associated factor 5 [Bombina bombina]|uniref:DDB1- and CUL4-associated factor 5 n=1 Tax=Bombina bombina TaxID=8345 RepID=UPI00235A6FF0|nr:DDB1- and CUL4-associated factor 5 [Bombina bombina]